MPALVRLAFPRLAALAALTLGLSMTLPAQTPSGVITGRVTLDDEPAPGVTVALLPADPWTPRESPPRCRRSRPIEKGATGSRGAAATGLNSALIWCTLFN